MKVKFAGITATDEVAQKWMAYRHKSFIDRKGNLLPEDLHNALEYASGWEKSPLANQYLFTVDKSKKNALIAQIEKAGYEPKVEVEPEKKVYEIGLTPIHQAIYGVVSATGYTKSENPEPWKMTQEEYVIHFMKGREKAHVIYGKPAGKTLDIAIAVETAKEVHEKMIEDAIQKGFPVPTEVLKDYPALMPKPKCKPRPLPPDAHNIQELPFDSEVFTCYGKTTKRGFRAYCRRKK